MKRLATADLHLSSYSTQKQKNGISVIIHDIFSSVIQMCNYAKSNRIKNIDILGDISHDKNIFYTKPFIEFRKFLKDNSDIIFTFLGGNHDLSDTSDFPISSIEGFSDIPNVICHTVMFIDDQLEIAWIPFSKNIKEKINLVSNCKILLSHFGLNEAMLSSGISITADVKIRDLKKFKLVLLGHYHKPQNIENVYYVGSPVQLNWGEKNEQKRFVVYDTENLNVQSINFEGYTKHIELIINNEEEVKSVLEQEKILKQQGNYVRIKNLLSKEIIAEGVHILNNVEKDFTNRGIDLNMPVEEKLQRYLQIKDIKNQKYLQTGRMLSKGVSVTYDSIFSNVFEIEDELTL